MASCGGREDDGDRGVRANRGARDVGGVARRQPRLRWFGGSVVFPGSLVGTAGP